ncbi:hypothetical protein DIPPA_30432 [Diplonema papillatum]|nr:hypothetical protein DIPPA_30432 [Diplonema papillatum]
MYAGAVPGTSLLSPPPQQAGGAAVVQQAASDDASAVIRPYVGMNDLHRPCGHNQWKKQTKKRGKLVLRCSICSAVWKTRPEFHQKCANFHAGWCEMGDECPHPHIYARRETASLARRKAKLAAGVTNDSDSDGSMTDNEESSPTTTEGSSGRIPDPSGKGARFAGLAGSSSLNEGGSSLPLHSSACLTASEHQFSTNTHRTRPPTNSSPYSDTSRQLEPFCPQDVRPAVDGSPVSVTSRSMHFLHASECRQAAEGGSVSDNSQNIEHFVTTALNADSPSDHSVRIDRPAAGDPAVLEPDLTTNDLKALLSALRTPAQPALPAAGN